MKKVITALLNKTVNEKLKEYNQINVVMNDIQYQEGIIEALEINPEIEYIILSELLPGELSIEDLVEKIKLTKSEIKIIIILEKENKKLENFLLAKGNIKIFYNNEIKIKEIVDLIIDINKSEELELEIKKLKELIMSKQENKELTNNQEINSNEKAFYPNNKLMNRELNNKEISNRKINNKEIDNIGINNKKTNNKEINNRYTNNEKTDNRLIDDIEIYNKCSNNNELNNIIIENNIRKNNTIYQNQFYNRNNEKDNILNEVEDKIVITEEEKRQIEDEIEKEYKQKTIKNKILNNTLIKKVTNRLRKQIINNNCKIIIISGINGVGKSFFIVNLSKALAEQKQNILIIDFDFNNNSIQTLFGVKSKIKNEEYTEVNEIENLIIKINSKIKLISNINLLYNKNNNKYIEILKLIEKLKNNFNFIIIDINNNQEVLNLIKDKSDKIIFITEPNILQIKKSKIILEKYLNELYLEKDKIYILYNKIKNDSINFNILKKVFKNYNTIGKINFINNYNTLINQNMKNVFLDKKIKKQYKNISKKLLQNNKMDEYYLEKINNS